MPINIKKISPLFNPGEQPASGGPGPEKTSTAGENKFNESKKVGMGWLAWILPFLLAASLVWWFLLGGKSSCNKASSSNTIQTISDTAGKH